MRPGAWCLQLLRLSPLNSYSKGYTARPLKADATPACRSSSSNTCRYVTFARPAYLLSRLKQQHSSDLTDKWAAFALATLVEQMCRAGGPLRSPVRQPGSCTSRGSSRHVTCQENPHIASRRAYCYVLAVNLRTGCRHGRHRLTYALNLPADFECAFT